MKAGACTPRKRRRAASFAARVSEGERRLAAEHGRWKGPGEARRGFTHIERRL